MSDNNISYLHSHTEYSSIRMLDCIIKLKDYVDKGVEIGAHALAITDHEAVCGAVKFIQYTEELKKKGKQVPKRIIGNEIYLVDSLEEVKDNYVSGKTEFYHFILLAKDRVGYDQIRELSSIAWRDNYFRTGLVERVPTIKADLERIVGENKGHIIAQTACLGSELDKLILSNDMDKAKEFIQWGTNLFGDGNFYLEMQSSYDQKQIIVNKAILELSKELNVPYVITCDQHYLNEEDLPILEAYLNSREDESREVFDFYKTTYMQPVSDIHKYMDEQIGSDNVDIGLQNTNMIADMVEEYDIYHTQVVPKGDIVEFREDHVFANGYSDYEYIRKFAYSENIRDRYFLHLIEQGWLEKEWREDLSYEEFHKMLARIDVELKAIWLTSEKINDNVATYYITALDLVNMMWDDSEDGGNSLVGVSRGSIAAFYTAYLIGLQQINSLEHNIPYWRHLNNYLS